MVLRVNLNEWDWMRRCPGVLALELAMLVSQFSPERRAIDFGGSRLNLPANVIKALATIQHAGPLDLSYRTPPPVLPEPRPEASMLQYSPASLAWNWSVGKTARFLGHATLPLQSLTEALSCVASLAGPRTHIRTGGRPSDSPRLMAHLSHTPNGRTQLQQCALGVLGQGLEV